MKHRLISPVVSSRPVSHAGSSLHRFVCLAALCVLPLITSAQTPGSVEAGYAPSVDDGSVLAAALQPDGKIVIGGSFTTVEGASHAALARINTDGTVDSGFNASTGNQVKNLAVLPDGSIIAAGLFATANGVGRIGIARFDSAGVLDSTFNPLLDNSSSALAIQPDGMLIIGGDFTLVAATGRNGIARLTASGALDAGFNPGTGANGTVSSITLQPDGKVLIGGSFTQINGVARNRIARLNANGSVDASFDPGAGADATVNNIELQPDGKMIVVGNFLLFNNMVVSRVVRLNADGSVEGRSTFDPGNAAGATVVNARLQADGKILIGGPFLQWNDLTIRTLLRLNSNGSRDTSFSAGTGGNGGGVQAQTQLADGRLVVSGDFTNFAGSARKRMVRLANGQAFQFLQAQDATKVQWLRGGTAPEAQFVTFEVSTNGGGSWTALGSGSRIAGGWELTGLSLPGTGMLRSRARIPGCYLSGSGLLEQVITFDLAVTVPVITSSTSTSLTTTGATLGGDVTSDGGAAIVERGVVCAPTSLTNSPTIGAPGVLKFTATGATGIFTTSATGLTPGISYTFRAYALNSVGSGYSGAAAFTTVSAPPLLASPTTTSVSNTTATLGGTVTGDGGAVITERGVVFAPTSINSNPQIGGTGVIVVVAASATDVFTVPVSGLSPGVGYSFKAYATNSVGSGYTSPVSTFTSHAAVAGALESPNAIPTGISGNVVGTQADGKVLFGGFYISVGGVVHSNISRFNADGTLDGSFTTSVNSVINCLATLPDGKILIGGQFGSVNGISRPVLARLNADGSLDGTFTPTIDATVDCIAVQPDGAILIAGNSITTVNGVSRIRIARLTSSGSLDATFDPGTGPNQGVSNIGFTAEGKIVICGSFTSYNGTSIKYIARLESNGSLESSATFNTGTGPDNGVNTFVIQPDGKIVIGGTFLNVNGAPRVRLARLNSDGSLEDTTAFKIGSGATGGGIFTLALQTNGKILVGGSFSTINGTSVTGIARLHPDGSLESRSGFDPGSGVTGGAVSCLAQQSDGKIWICGTFTTVDGASRKMLARLSNDPATQLLSATSAATTQWLRGDAATEVLAPSFELSTDGGVNWTLLGNGTRMNGGWQLTGLSLPTTGSLRAHGRTFGAKSSSVIQQVTTFDLGVAFPTITSPTSSNVLSNAATLGGDVTSAGGAPITERGVVYALTSVSNDPQIGAPGVIKVSTGGTTGVFTADVSGLAPAGSYSFKAYAINSAGVAFTSVGTFTTTAAPTVITPASSLIGPDSATLGGNVTGDNGFAITERGVVLAPFATNTDPVIGGFGVIKVATSGTTGVFTLNTANLSASTLYVFKAYAINSNGAGYSPSGFFTTQAPTLPSASIASMNTTAGAGAPVTTGASANGAAITERGLVYSITTTNNNPTIGGTGVSQLVIGSGTGFITGIISALNTNTNYSVRAYAINSVGTGYSTASNFTTDITAEGALNLSYDSNAGGGPVYAHAEQPDGRIIIAGNFSTVGGVARSRIARLMPDGSLDVGFNASVDGIIQSVAVQSDGKILLGGFFANVNGVARARCARLNADGTLDNAFDASPNAVIYGIAVQPDGKVLIAGGFTLVNGTARGRIARLNGTDGSLDTSFAAGSGGDSNIYCMVPQADGRLLIGGGFATYDGTAISGIARLTSSGTVDASFNPGTGPSGGFVLAIAQQPDGNVLIGGSFTSFSGTTANRIARVTSTGGLDISFNAGTGPDALVRNIALQTNGRVLIAGDFTTVNGSPRNRLARLNANGGVEPLSLFSIGTGANSAIQTLSLLADGSIFIAGNFTQFRSIPRSCVARLGNGPASQALLSPDASAVVWQRTGTAAELTQVSIELSTNGGVNWSSLGTPKNFSGTWSVSELSLPNSGKVRARGRPTSGSFSGSSGFFEQTIDLISTPALTWNYNSATDVPVTAGSYAPNGAVTLTLNFTPAAGTTLTVVNNTGNHFISGGFPNLTHGQIITLTFNGVGYDFIVNYYGGSGNDLVLEWADRRAVAWGENANGELGNNSTTGSYAPVAITSTGVLSGKRVLRSVAGQDHALALCTDGTLAAWGVNTNGQLGNNSTANTLVPVLVDQTGVLAGKTIVAIAAGAQHSLVLCSDGTLAAWGVNTNGELGDGTNSESHVPVLVSASGVLAGKTVAAIAAGAHHNLALCIDGTLVAWGLNGNGQLGNNSTTASNVPVLVDASGVLDSRVARGVAAGLAHSLVYCSDGSAASWGDNSTGQLGDSSINESHVPVHVDVSGSLFGKVINAIASGGAHSLALFTDGTLCAWGNNGHGQIGDDSLLHRITPVVVVANGALSGHTISGLSAGATHSLAFSTDGYAFTWGRNQLGQLGNNKKPLHETTPVMVSKDAFASGEAFLRASAGPGSETSLGIVAKPIRGPQIVIEQPLNTRLTDSAATIAFRARAGSKHELVFTLRNSGVLPLTGLGITIDGADASSFSVITNPVAPVNPGKNTTFTVRFAPTSNGMKSAALHIASNDLDDTPFDIALAGNTPIASFDFATKTLSEATTNVTIPVRLDSPAGAAFTIPVTYGGTALKGTDYIAPASVSFSATATAASLVIAVKEDALNEGDETVIATLGAPTSANVMLGAVTISTLTITDDEIAPNIAPQPLSQIVGIGDPVSFISGTSAGSAPLTLQWKRNGTVFSGATAGTFNIASATLADATAYMLIASNPKATVPSNIAQLAVVDTSTRILRFNAGTSPTMTVIAAGNGLTYQWFKGATQLGNDAKYAGVTSKTLTVKTAVTGDIGSYTCKVTAPGGTKASGSFELQIPTQIPITTQPAFDDGVLNNAFSYQLAFDTDPTRAPTKFICTDLPTGLVCNPITGLISGTLKATGSFTVKVKLSNSVGPALEVQDTMIVSAIPLTTVGSYVALIARHTLNEELGGRLDVTTMPTGSFTGTLKLGGNTLPALSGTLVTAAGGHPQRTLTIARKGLPSLVLFFDLDPLTNALTGTVQEQGSPTSAAITGWRNIWRTTAPLNPVPTSMLGLHAFEIEPDSVSNGQPEVPQGCGYGTLTVTTAGATTITGRSADGGTLNCTGLLGPNGEVIFYQPLSSNRATLLGTLTINTNPNHSIDSTLTWKKHAMTTAAFDYKAGFGTINVNVFGGLYTTTTPLLSLPVTAVGTNNARLLFGEGGIGSSATNPNVPLRISNTNTITLPPAGVQNPGKITKLSVTATGGFSGTMILTDSAVPRTVSFQGQLVPTDKRGYGYFLLPKLADPDATPPTTLKTSPIFSGWVVLESL